MIKVSVLLKRKPGMSPTEFHRYWKEVHGPLVLGVPEVMRYVRRYVQCHSIAGGVFGHTRNHLSVRRNRGDVG